MKNALFYVTTLILTFTSLVLAYYIFANTFQTEKPLFNYTATSYLYKDVQVTFLGENYSVRTRYVPVQEEAKNYGRGADLGKVLAEGIDLLGGTDSDKFYSIDTEYLISSLHLPFAIGSVNNVQIDSNNYLKNCSTSTYDLKFNVEKLTSDLHENEVSLSLDQYLTNPDQLGLMALCEEYKSERIKVAAMLDPYFENVDSYLNYSLTTKKFEIADLVKTKQKFQEFSDEFTASVVDPSYEEVNGSIYILSSYENGYALDVDQTIENLQFYLSGVSQGFNIETYSIKPQALNLGKPVYDFSNEIARGETRIELVRNGFANYVIQFADFGLYEVHNHIIQPGEEFSFLKVIQPKNGLTKSGFPIDGGICNSTTTIFRAALEAGLPITERYYHYKNVPSYDWPYQMNIVDSAYFTDPKVDLKFKNDSNYPILIRFEKTQKDGFQYNTVKFLSDKNFVKRSVQLTNWKKWNEYSPTQFEASFDRVVYESGVEISRDNFYSRYLD